MKTRAQIIQELKLQFPTLKLGDDDAGYTDLSSEEYEATIEQWADAKLAKETAKLEAEQLRQTKISAYQKLGLSEAEIEALVPTPQPRILTTE